MTLLHLGDTTNGAGGATVHGQRGLQGMAGDGEAEPEVGAAAALGPTVALPVRHEGAWTRRRAAVAARRPATAEVCPCRRPTRVGGDGERGRGREETAWTHPCGADLGAERI